MVKILYRDNEEIHTINDLHELFTEHQNVLCFNNFNENHEVLILTLDYNINNNLYEIITIDALKFGPRMV